MKTRPTSAAQATPHRFTVVHWFITVFGVLTAVMCSLILLDDLKTNNERGEQNLFVDVPPVVIPDFTKVTADHIAVSILEIL